MTTRGRLHAAAAVAGSLPLGHRARKDATARQLSGVALWGSLLLVTYWWVSDGGIGRLVGGLGPGLLELGRLSGLVASVLLLAQVILMARLPVLEQAFGQDRLARIHRIVGFTGFNLMVFHVVTVTWGYAAGSVGLFLSTLWNLTLTYPGMLLAVAGSAALTLVVVTSIKASRRRLRYESWHLLHLYAYLGVGLALPHQLWSGHEFITSPGRSFFWWSAWGAAAGAILIWRVIRPLWISLRHGMRVTSVVREGPGIWSVYITGRDIHDLVVEPGQFFTWRFLDRPGWTRANPYSLSAAPDGRSLRITVQGVGDGSLAMRHLKVGTRVLAEGPYGRLSPRVRTRRKVAFIGAGVGITPLRALAEGMQYSPGDAVYIERYRDKPLFAGEVDILARERGLHVLRLPGKRRAPDSWLPRGTGSANDASVLRAWVPDIAERDVFVCGPEPWSELVTRTLTSLGLPEEHIHLETFAW